MGYRFWTGKPPRRRTRHLERVPAKAREVNRHIAWYTSQYPWSCSVRWCPLKGSFNGDQRWRIREVVAQRRVRDEWCATKIHIYLLTYYVLRTDRTAVRRSVMVSGAVEGERRYPKYLGDAVPPNNIRIRGNGDTVAFHQIVLQRNEKSR